VPSASGSGQERRSAHGAAVACGGGCSGESPAPTGRPGGELYTRRDADLVTAGGPACGYRGLDLSRSAPRGHESAFRERLRPYGSLGDHRPQDPADAQALNAPARRGSGQAAGLSLGPARDPPETIEGLPVSLIETQRAPAEAIECRQRKRDRGAAHRRHRVSCVQLRLPPTSPSVQIPPVLLRRALGHGLHLQEAIDQGAQRAHGPGIAGMGAAQPVADRVRQRR